MSEKKKTTPPARRGAAPKFSVARLREDCAGLFGVTQSTFDGAAYGMPGTYTVAEMRKRIENWRESREK